MPLQRSRTCAATIERDVVGAIPRRSLERARRWSRTCAACCGRQKLPGLLDVVEPEGDLHATDTVDFAVVLSGEVWLELDDGAQVLVRNGDCVVQYGTRHTWHNRSGQPCVMAVTIIGATRAALDGCRRPGVTASPEGIMFRPLRPPSIDQYARFSSASTRRRRSMASGPCRRTIAQPRRGPGQCQCATRRRANKRWVADWPSIVQFFRGLAASSPRPSREDPPARRVRSWLAKRCYCRQPRLRQALVAQLVIHRRGSVARACRGVSSTSLGDSIRPWPSLARLAAPDERVPGLQRAQERAGKAESRSRGPATAGQR